MMFRNKTIFFVFSLLLMLVFSLHSCKKNMFYQGKDAVLSFETDTLRFDTVFTEMATITRFFKVHNNSNATVMAQLYQ